MSGQSEPQMDAEGQRLFDAMVRWRALATTTVLLGFAAGFAQLIVSGTAGKGSLSRGLAGVAVLFILAAIVSTFVAWNARRRFVAWYVANGHD